MQSFADIFIPFWVTPGAEGVHLRGLCGADEIAVNNTGTAGLLKLLNALILHEASGNKKIDAAQIVTADRDRLLAMLYISLYGAKVDSTLSCTMCGQKFDLDFSLEELLRHYQIMPVISDHGKYQLEPGISFRLPNGEDELFIQGLNQEEAERQLIQRCLLEGNAEKDNEKVQLKMAELAPVLSMDLQAVCPECGNEQQVQFDMQSFFLTKLKQEKPILIREIHHIAASYHWSQHEILSLPRNLRKQYAALIDADN